MVQLGVLICVMVNHTFTFTSQVDYALSAQHSALRPMENHTSD